MSSTIDFSAGVVSDEKAERVARTLTDLAKPGINATVAKLLGSLRAAYRNAHRKYCYNNSIRREEVDPRLIPSGDLYRREAKERTG